MKDAKAENQPDAGVHRYWPVLLVTKSRVEKLISWHNAILRDKAGKIIGTLSSGEDISQRRKLEDEHLKMEKLESLGVLAGGLAHDFNNLLTGILSNVGLAKLTAGSPEETVVRLEQAEKASLRARDLIQQLLTFSKGGAPIRKSVSIVELVRESVGFALRGSNVACEYQMGEDLSPVSVDESQISQVIHNLILNADQAMPAGGTVTVSLRNKIMSADEIPGLESGNYVLLSVADRGAGIPQDQLPRIFDPYFTTKTGGSGLGLATVYSIVQRHGGHVAVDSEVNRGTTFRVYLPATASTVVPRETPGETLITGRGRELVMDDDELIRKAAGEMLRRLGYEVALAQDGEEALEKYRKARADNQPLDILIMDLTIPGGMGGKETIQKLREIDPEVRAIVSSGYSSDPVMAEAGKYGFKGVVAKPYGIAELSRVIDHVMRKRELPGA
jgi:signal transduction histidine kinase/CheY-like chemotaxis protein